MNGRAEQGVRLENGQSREEEREPGRKKQG
jgi:hypothetical protein